MEPRIRKTAAPKVRGALAAPALAPPPVEGPLRSDRLAKAVEMTATTGDARHLMAETAQVLSAADPRNRVAIARAVGEALAGHRGRVEGALRTLAATEGNFWFRAFAAEAYAARAIADVDPRGADAALQALAESDAEVREAVIDAVRARLDARGEEGIEELSAWTDGFLQAHVALAALADKTRLAALGEGAAHRIVDRLDEAFSLADLAPRSADRSQGLRTLRRALPGQIALFASRFSRQLFTWFEGKLAAKRPETREVIAETIAALRKASLSVAEAGRLRGALDASEKPPRDPSRIVKGMRGRGKKRGL